MTVTDTPSITKSTSSSVTVEIPADAIPAKPVPVSSSPLAGLFRQFGRHGLLLAAGWAANHFYHDGNVTAEAMAMVGIALAIADGIWERITSNKVKRTLTKMLPNQLAFLK